MDPSSGRNKDSNPSPPDSQNPFIKFKNFADAQVSTLLQGITGLPSAISRRSSEHKWADIDEDLRRRDELQAKQKLMEAQWREAMGATEAKAGFPVSMAREETPMKPPQYLQASQTSEYTSREKAAAEAYEQASSDDEKKYNPKAIQDLPLYSPVKKELFEHLDDRCATAAVLGALPGLSALSGLGLGLGHQAFNVPPDSNSLIKMLSLTMLKVSSIFHSEYSLLPYLLFSPYSPIKLESEACTSRRQDKFKYCAAFEDLIRISQGRESGSHSHDTSERHSNSVFFNIRGQSHFFWLLYLQRDGVMQQRRRESDPAPDLQPWRALNSFPNESELDVFEHVEKMIKSPLVTSNITALGGLFGQSQRPSEQEIALPHTHFYILGPSAKELNERHGLTHERFTKEDAERVRAVLQATEQTGMAPAVEKKVVSTSTTTNRCTDEDGTVGTTVTICKFFDDGSSTTITTSHEEPGPQYREQFISHDGSGHKKEEKDSEKEKKEKEKEKKGWFWN